MGDNRSGMKRKLDERGNDNRSFKFKVMLPNRVVVDLRLRPEWSEKQMELADFIKIVRGKYMKIKDELRREPERQVQWTARNVYFQDANDNKIRERILFANFEPNKCHILRLCDGSRVESDAFENMWDLTPDVELLRELPEEYSFVAALADLIDNSLQAVWGNATGERKLIRVEVNQKRISIFDTGPGMDDTDHFNITKWGKMGASLHRACKIKSIGGEPPYLKPFFGMFGYGGPIASMYLGRNVKVFSKTKQSKKVFVLNLKRDALLNSGSELTWRTTGGLRDPLEDEVKNSPHGSFTKVAISELKITPLEAHQLQCMLKDIYFPYIQCDGVSNAGKTMTPVTFQVNDVDLAEVAGGEVSITNLHSCNGEEFIFQLHFAKQDNVTTGNPGFKASQKAHARLRCVYFPMVKGKESIEMIQESLEAEGCGSNETSETFSHVSIRRLGRLLPDARWSMLPFMDFRLRRGDNTQLLKKCSSRVKCFIETDGGFNPTISKTDLAHHSSFTDALKNFGKKMTESATDISIEIYRDGKLLTLSQLEKKYQDWILGMHDSFDEEMDSGVDDPILVIGANKKALGISADVEVLRVHRVFKRKGTCWKHGQNIKILKGACSRTQKNSVYATLEYFFITGFKGDAGGEARIICRPLGTSDAKGCVLEVNEGNTKLLIGDSWCLPVNVIDSGKCKAVESSEWSVQLEKQQQKNLRIDLLSSQHCEELNVDGELPSLAQIDTGHVFPRQIVAVVRPGNYNSANISRNLDQKDIFRTAAQMSVQVIFENDRNSPAECLCAAQATSSSYEGIHGFYIFELGNVAPNAFEDSGVYKFLFSLAASSCKSFEKTVKVREASRVHNWKILGDKSSQPHKVRVGSNFPLIRIGCFDASHNRKPFTFDPKLTVKLKLPNGKSAQINRLKTTLSSDNLDLQIKNLLIECNELDSIRPSYEAFLLICPLNESDALSVPCQVTPGSLQNVKVHLPKAECLLPDLVVDEFALEMLDEYGNHIAEGSEVELDVDGFKIMDQTDSKWEVDSNGFINLSGQLQVKAGFGSIVSISVSCEGVVIRRQFQIMKRELRVISEVPETSIAGSRLENVVFEIVDSSGNTDETFHDDQRKGHYHSLVIKSVFFSTEDIIELAFSKGRCVVPVIIIPQMEGPFCFTAAHSHYTEIQLNFKVSVMRTPNVKSEAVEPPVSDEKILPVQDEQPLNIESFLTPEIKNQEEKLEACIKLLGEQIDFYENKLSALEKQKGEAIAVMSQLEASLDPDLCKNLDYVISKKVMLDQIQRSSSSAAVILKHLHCEVSFNEPEECFMQDVVGVVALLGTVGDNRISRILSGYLGEDHMLAVVCKSYEAVSAMEKYKEDGEVDSNLALHGKAAALGKPICGRFLVICLENIRPYNGKLEGSGSDRKLCLPDPILPCGNVPVGFKGYAVNLINQADHKIVSATGHGLRETLFYRLFGESQVYETRKDMINARSCIKHGAISLDGGIMKENGIISLGHGNPEICFPVPTALEDERLKYQLIEQKNEYRAKEAEVKLTNRKIEKVTKRLSKVRNKFNKKAETFNHFLDFIQTQISEHEYRT